MNDCLELASVWTPVLGARYAPERVLARGGFGVVVQASERRTGRRVAIKLLRREHGADPQVALRFLQEAAIVSELVHPHVLTLVDFGIDRGNPFIVLPFVEGASLRDRLAAGPMDWRTVARFARDIAQGLAAIHAAAVVHCDLKPDNIMIDEGGEPLITDFGVSMTTATSFETAAGTILGTPGYVPPEALREQPVGWPSDMYALGVMLYEMLAGHRPLQRVDPADPASARSLSEELIAVLEVEPVPIAELVPDCPRWLDALIRELLAHDPDERPPAHLVADDLVVRMAARPVEETIRCMLLPA